MLISDPTGPIPGVCVVHKDKMLSFDGTPILLPVHREQTTGRGGANCDVLLASDCSGSSLFAVSGSMRRGQWAVKIMSAQHRIEVVSRSHHNEIETRVNNEQVTVTYAHPVKIHEGQNEER